MGNGELMSLTCPAGVGQELTGLRAVGHALEVIADPEEQTDVEVNACMLEGFGVLIRHLAISIERRLSEIQAAHNRMEHAPKKATK
jgi:hypothetical protein